MLWIAKKLAAMPQARRLAAEGHNLAEVWKLIKISPYSSPDQVQGAFIALGTLYRGEYRSAGVEEGAIGGMIRERLEEPMAIAEAYYVDKSTNEAAVAHAKKKWANDLTNIDPDFNLDRKRARLEAEAHKYEAKANDKDLQPRAENLWLLRKAESPADVTTNPKAHKKRLNREFFALESLKYSTEAAEIAVRMAQNTHEAARIAEAKSHYDKLAKQYEDLKRTHEAFLEVGAPPKASGSGPLGKAAWLGQKAILLSTVAATAIGVWGAMKYGSKDSSPTDILEFAGYWGKNGAIGCLFGLVALKVASRFWAPKPAVSAILSGLSFMSGAAAVIIMAGMGYTYVTGKAHEAQQMVEKSPFAPLIHMALPGVLDESANSGNSQCLIDAAHYKNPTETDWTGKINVKEAVETGKSSTSGTEIEVKLPSGATVFVGRTDFSGKRKGCPPSPK